MSHTPGPWTYEKRRSDEYLIKGDIGCGYIATVYAAMVGDGPFEANARVISAAPDLYLAAKAVESMQWNDNPLVRAYKTQLDNLSKAIAKAEGKDKP